MKNIKNALLISFLLVCSFQQVYSQLSSKTKSQMRIAENEHKKLHYLSAISYLTPVLAADSNNVRAQELIANSYRNLRNYDGALHWYAKLTKQQRAKPEWVLYYAEALANKEK